MHQTSKKKTRQKEQLEAWLMPKAISGLKWKSSFVKPTAVPEITHPDLPALVKALSGVEPEFELSANGNVKKNIPVSGYILMGAKFFQAFVTPRNLVYAKAKQEEAAEMALTVPDVGLVKDLIDNAEETMNLYTCKHSIEFEELKDKGLLNSACLEEGIKEVKTAFQIPKAVVRA